MDDREKPKCFAEDDSKNPPAKSLVDKLTRRFSRSAYTICVLVLYLLAATVLGLALTPSLWFFSQLIIVSKTLTPFIGLIILGVGLALCFFIFGFALLIVVPIYNWILPTRVRAFKGGYYS